MLARAQSEWKKGLDLWKQSTQLCVQHSVLDELNLGDILGLEKTMNRWLFSSFVEEFNAE